MVRPQISKQDNKQLRGLLKEIFYNLQQTLDRWDYLQPALVTVQFY